MFDVGFGEVLVIAVAALFVFGPDRLPEMAAKAGRLVRELRAMAAGARAEFSDAVGPELTELAELRKLVRPDLLGLSELDPRTDVQQAINEAKADPTPPRQRSTSPAQAAPSVSAEPPPFDADAT